MTTIKRGAELAAQAAIARRTEELLRAAGADVSHPSAVLHEPVVTSELCAFLAIPHRAADEAARIDGVVAAAVPADLVLAFETARQLRVRVGWVDDERVATGFEPGERLLLVGLTDERFEPLIAAVETAGGEIVECAAVVAPAGRRPRLASPDSGRVYTVRVLSSRGTAGA